MEVEVRRSARHMPSRSAKLETHGTVPTPHPPRVRAAPGSPSAALELFARRGVSGTSLQDIADHLGVTKAAVYYQFRSKEGDRPRGSPSRRPSPTCSGFLEEAEAAPPRPSAPRRSGRWWAWSTRLSPTGRRSRH